MLKDLQEQIKLEKERMTNELTQSFKDLLSDDGVVVSITDGLEAITMTLVKKSEKDNAKHTTSFTFTSVIGEDNKTKELFTAMNTAVLYSNDMAVGSYTQPITVEVGLIMVVFNIINDFRKKEAAPAN